MKYLNMNVAEEEIDRNPDIVRLYDADKDKYMEFVNVKVLEDIKAEIESKLYRDNQVQNNIDALTMSVYNNAILDALSIIDSHISEKGK